ncbi:MAG TPA: hypothetical protein VGJ18_06970 [Gemmatimonadaceae bacterium]
MTSTVWPVIGAGELAAELGVADALALAGVGVGAVAAESVVVFF